MNPQQQKQHSDDVRVVKMLNNQSHSATWLKDHAKDLRSVLKRVHGSKGLESLQVAIITIISFLHAKTLCHLHTRVRKVMRFCTKRFCVLQAFRDSKLLMQIISAPTARPENNDFTFVLACHRTSLAVA